MSAVLARVSFRTESGVAEDKPSDAAEAAAPRWAAAAWTGQPPAG